MTIIAWLRSWFGRYVPPTHNFVHPNALMVPTDDDVEWQERETDRYVRFFAQEMADRWWHSKVVGTTGKNDDGSDRQELIQGCRPQDLLILVPEPNNPLDKYAVQVLNRENKQLGFLAGRSARELTTMRKRGERYMCLVRSVHVSDGVCDLTVCLFELNDEFRANILAAERGKGE